MTEQTKDLIEVELCSYCDEEIIQKRVWFDELLDFCPQCGSYEGPKYKAFVEAAEVEK